MKLLSINVGLPREVKWRGKAVRTSIFNAPVAGRVRVTKLNLRGDEQSDLSVHGGADKAVYAVAAGDAIDLVAKDDNGITVADIVKLYRDDEANQDLLRRASRLSALPDSWREYFRERLRSPAG